MSESSEASNPPASDQNQPPETHRWFRLLGSAESAAFQLWILMQAEDPDKEKSRELGTKLGMTYPVLVASEDSTKIKAYFLYPELYEVHRQMYLKCPIGKGMDDNRKIVDETSFIPAESKLLDAEFVEILSHVIYRPILQRTPITVFNQDVNPFDGVSFTPDEFSP